MLTGTPHTGQAIISPRWSRANCLRRSRYVGAGADGDGAFCDFDADDGENPAGTGPGSPACILS